MGGDDGPHVAHLGERRLVRLPHPEEPSEVAGQRLRRRLADLRDPERVEEAGKREPPALLHPGEKVVGRERAHAFEGRDLPAPLLQPVEVGDRLHEPGIDELVDELLAKALDVHRPPAREMADRLLALGRAAEAGRAAGRRLPLDPDRGGAAHRTLGGHLEARRARGAALGVRRPQDLRDHVPGPPHHHPVAHPHVLAGDLVLVVQGRVGDRDPADEHRLEPRHRGERPGPPHLDVDGEEPGDRLLRRELVGQRPAGGPRHRPEAALVFEAVDLVDDPVDLVAEPFPPGLDLAVVGHAAGDPPDHAHVGRDPQAPFVEAPQEAVVGGGGRNVLGASRAVAEEHEAAGPRGAGIELAEPPGGRVPRIHELALPPLPLLLVEALEPVERQVDLPADLEAIRKPLPREPERDGANGAHVPGHVFPARPVPARRGHREAPMLVAQAHRDPVELGLGHVFDLLPFPEPEPLARAPVEVGDPRLLEGVGEGEHGDLVDHLREPFRRGAADPLGGGIGIGKFGVRGLQGEELRE